MDELQTGFSNVLTPAKAKQVEELEKRCAGKLEEHNGWLTDLEARKATITKV